MASIRNNFLILSLIICFLLSLVTNWYTEISIFLIIITIFAILDKLGKGLVLRELVVLHTIFICLVMPSVGYGVYNHDNYLARIFYRYMLVPENVYFGFTLPAVCAFSISMCYPITKKDAILDEGNSFKNLLRLVRNELIKRTNTGIIIVATGVMTFFFIGLVPESVKFVVTLLFFSSFAGILYIYYSPPMPSKNILLVLFALFIMGLAVQSGVFTVVVYMGITLFSFLFLGRKFALWKKLLVFVIGVFILFIVQNVKTAYRDVTWRDNVVDNKTSLFVDIAIDKLGNIDKLIDVDGFFPVYMRTNQGYNISVVMRRIPAQQEFDDGSHLLATAASALVPRFLWPDKPQAGGKESMKYYAGFSIEGWSTNVSPLGEAYASFGPVGGIFYMFVLGLFIRWVYKRVFVIAQKLPLLVLWMPVLFYQVTYSMETDSLQIFNSLLKGAFFLWLLYKLVPAWFGNVVKQSNARGSFRRRQVPA
ncbi:MAG TPA: hypothetical protein DIC22_01980 [Chitinophagaceae bacterium]|nr:hypothetical protein [Chitinophagaceae bacterium]